MDRTKELKSRSILTLEEFGELFNLDRSFVSWRITLFGILGYDPRGNVVRMLAEKSPLDKSQVVLSTGKPLRLSSYIS